MSKIWDEKWSQTSLKEYVYSEVAQEHYKLIESKIKEAINIHEIKNVLEPGCGTAACSLFLAKAGCHIVGLDLSKPALFLAKKLYENEGLNQKMYLIQSDVGKLPFRSNVFDLTWNHGVIEHFNNISITQVIAEMVRVTKPSRHICAITPHALSWWVLSKHVINLLHKMGLRKGWPRGWEKSFFPFQLRKLFHKQGLEQIKTEVFYIHETLNPSEILDGLPFIRNNTSDNSSYRTLSFLNQIRRRVFKALERRGALNFIGAELLVLGRKIMRG